MFQFGNNTCWTGEKGGCVGEQPASRSSSTVKGKGETCSLARIEEEPARGAKLAWKDACIRSICIFNTTPFVFIRKILYAFYSLVTTVCLIFTQVLLTTQ